jgi:hypothetical protein
MTPNLVISGRYPQSPGLVATAVFGLWLDVVEPVGWWRLAAIPPVLAVGILGMLWLVFGLPTTGPGGPERDARTILYSYPPGLVVAVVATILIALPLALQALASRRVSR